MELLTEEQQKKVASDLNDMVVANEYKIGTGFLTTPAILPVLTRYGYVDTAYKMIENTKQPGWLYAVTKKATTIWENWYGRDENNKFNLKIEVPAETVVTMPNGEIHEVGAGNWEFSQEI